MTLQKFDAAVLLVGCVALSCTTACVSSLWAASASLLLGLIILAVWRFQIKIIWHRFLAVNIFIFFAWLIVPFTTPGQIIWQWKFLEISLEGLALCILITLKANAILAIFTGLCGRIQPTELGQALTVLHCPPRLGWLFILMERNTQLLSKQWHILATAAELRGFKSGTNLHTYRTYGAMLAAFLLRAYDEAATLNQALELRGGVNRLPFQNALHWPWRDIWLGGVIAVAIVFIIFLDCQQP